MSVVLGALIALTAIAVMVAGLLAFLRNQERSENRWFFVLSLALGLWLIANYVDSNLNLKLDVTSFVVKSDFILALFVGWCFLQFASHLAQNFGVNRWWTRLALGGVFRVISFLLTLAVVVLICVNRIFMVATSPNAAVVHFQSLSTVYILLVASYLLSSLLVMLACYIVGGRLVRRRLSLIVLGFSISAITNVLTNLIFPSVISERSAVQGLNVIGHLGIVFLVLCLYIAITTRRLFDIRLALVRGLVYVLLIGSVATAYAGLVTLSSYLFLNRQLPNAKLIAASLVIALFVAFTFQYLRKFLDKVTQRIFLQDTYDLKEVVDQINAVTTTTTHLQTLLSRSERVLRTALKASYCTFILFDGENKVRIESEVIDPALLKVMLKECGPSLRERKPVVVELLEEQSAVAKIMKKTSAEVVFPLYTQEGNIGCLVLGGKQTGIVYTQRDLGLLSIVAGTLSVALRNALRFEEIERFNVTLQQRVDDATRKLRASNEKLRALDQTKDDFISMASHQLRTPLTSVKGYVSMVLDGDAGPVNSMQRKLLNQSFASSQRMVYLIADLLNISRLKTGRFVIEPTPTNLAQITRDEVSQLIETAKSRGLELTYDKPQNFPTYMLDTVKIRQVIMNFVDNAIYYTKSGGHIHIELEDKPKSIELRVVDDGIGVPRDLQHHLFSKFYRAPNAQKARPDGTGLGLFMAKKVVVAQGGAIIFESTEGKGSTFGFSFAKSHLTPAPTK